MFKKFLGLSALAVLVSGAAFATGAQETQTQTANVSLVIEKYVAITAPSAIALDYDPATSSLTQTGGLFQVTANTPGHLTLGTPVGNFLPSWTVTRSFSAGDTFGAGVTNNSLVYAISGISNVDPASTYNQTIPVTATAD